VNPVSQDTVGEVFAVSTSASLDAMWKGFVGLFFMTAVVVLMIAFLASSVTAMRQVRPIREMVQATRRYAEGDFDVRMKDFGRDDEVGELVTSFNNMADSLQQTERQRREFMANISHELKTPMTTIAGYTDGILDGTIPPENERQYLQIISDESRRLSRMVRRMLDVSQLEATDPLRGGAHFDICESMRRVLISMERKITGRRLDVDADIPEEPILVLGDNDMITQVIYNLLDNATKFGREGSTLYLGVTTMDGKARVTVRNQGDTIPAEELPLLFERFHKSDKSRSEDKDGVGLGLYIVKTILEQHRETINVTSENGVTTFTFSLTTE
jgi:signal transduction histidine kinase